jgi:uncharacterized protein YbjT (DUF2867 family)
VTFQRARRTSDSVRTSRSLRAARPRREHNLKPWPYNDAAGRAGRTENNSKMSSVSRENNVIAIVGATGAQGGGLARAILNDQAHPFRVRALTRNPNSAAASELARRGAEVVRIDLDNLDSVRAGFSGAAAAFCVTNFWEHFSPEREVAQARNMALASKQANLGHVVWSTLEDTRRWMTLDDDRMPTLHGKYKVPHFDGKGESNHWFIEAGVPTTFLLTSFYWDNLIYFRMGPRRAVDGTLAITFPLNDRKMPSIAAEDIGRCAYGLLKRGREFLNQTVGIAGEHLTGAEMAARLTAAIGERVRYDSVSPEAYRTLDFPDAIDLANMFQFKRDFEADFCAARSVAVSRSLNPLLQTFEQWLAQNVHRLPRE